MWTRLLLQFESGDADLADLALAELWAAGAQGAEVRDHQTFSDFDESPFRTASIYPLEIIAYFPPEADFRPITYPEEVRRVLRQSEACAIDPDEWQEGWRQFFRPTRASERITVRPSWEEELPPGDHHTVLVVDPRMAFGTGTHETTQLCIQAIDELLAERPPRSVLDVGCGSGILTMCAARLGASEVLGIDVEQIAVDVARQNWAINGLGAMESAPFSTTPLAEVGKRFDLVVANMLSGILRRLRSSLIDALDEQGVLILSGITEREQRRFIDLFTGDRLRVLDLKTMGDWVSFRLTQLHQ